MADNDTPTEYDPSKVDFRKRDTLEEIRKYLTNKGLQCVWVKEESEQEEDAGEGDTDEDDTEKGDKDEGGPGESNTDKGDTGDGDTGESDTGEGNTNQEESEQKYEKGTIYKMRPESDIEDKKDDDADDKNEKSTDEKSNETGKNYLPKFDKLLDDPDAPIEFVTFEPPDDYYPTDDSNIERKVIDKEKLKKPEGESKPVTDFDVLLQDYTHLPYIEEKKQANVIRRHSLVENVKVSKPSPPDLDLEHRVLTEKEFKVLLTEISNAESSNADISSIDIIGNINLPPASEPDEIDSGEPIKENEVESKYELDLSVLKEFNFILRCGRAYFDLTDFFRWRANFD